MGAFIVVFAIGIPIVVLLFAAYALLVPTGSLVDDAQWLVERPRELTGSDELEDDRYSEPFF